jgi:hypothetical protein
MAGFGRPMSGLSVAIIRTWIVVLTDSLEVGVAGFGVRGADRNAVRARGPFSEID